MLNDQLSKSHMTVQSVPQCYLNICMFIYVHYINTRLLTNIMFFLNKVNVFNIFLCII